MSVLDCEDILYTPASHFTLKWHDEVSNCALLLIIGDKFTVFITSRCVKEYRELQSIIFVS